MSGNTTGRLFTLTTCGESHGSALVGIVDGCPSGFELSENDIQLELERRRVGVSCYVSQRSEIDKLTILSGVFEGKTTGAPVGFIIHNHNQRSSDYDALRNIIRPGHADYTYYHKYGHRDHRGGGRASARETATWVAAGAIAKKYLRDRLGINIQGYVSQIGDIFAEEIDLSFVNENRFFFPDKSKLQKLHELFITLRREGNSIGAKVTVMANHVPVGLGSPVFDKLDADIAKAMMSINAVKGVEIGDGFSVVLQKGSCGRDAVIPDGFTSNHAGGILGGISTGQPIVINVAFKPTSSIMVPISSIDLSNQPVVVQIKGRHDPCVGIRAVPVVEARLALVLMDHYLQNCAGRNEGKHVNVL